MSSYDFLYYPYINFRNETWLKKMALYADSVTRIVPDGYPTVSSKVVDLLSQEKFVKPFDPDEAGDKPARMFSRFLQDYRQELLPMYAVNKAGEWYSDLEDAHVREEAINNKAYVSVRKLSGANVEAMVDTGLVVKGRNDDLDWVGMHPRLANTFMTLLMNATVLKQPNLKPVADFGSNAVDAHINREEDLLHTLVPSSETDLEHKTIQDIFVTYAFEQVLPANIEELDIEEILELRRNFSDELTRFQTAVEKFSVDHALLENFTETDRMVEYLDKQYKKDVQPSITDLKKAFAGIKLETVMSAMSVSFTPPLLASTYLPLNPVLAAIAGGALGICSIVKTSSDARKSAIKNCDYSWLYRIEREFQPMTLIQELRQRTSSLWRTG